MTTLSSLQKIHSRELQRRAWSIRSCRGFGLSDAEYKKEVLPLLGRSRRVYKRLVALG
jgi:hypothetical protein